jgi:hypothetical protein
LIWLNCKTYNKDNTVMNNCDIVLYKIIWKNG